MQLSTVLENKDTWIRLTTSNKGHKSKLVNGSGPDCDAINSSSSGGPLFSLIEHTEWSNAERSGVDRSGVGWSGVDRSGVDRFGVDRFGVGCEGEGSRVMTFPCVNAVVDWLARGRDPAVESLDWQTPEQLSGDYHLQVFVTGSLYLVGNTFIALNEAVC